MRGSGAAALALVGASVVVAFGCAGAPAPVELGDKRRPDGVAVDPMTRFGDVDDATRSSAGIAVLRTPPDDRTVRDAVGDRTVVGIPTKGIAGFTIHHASGGDKPRRPLGCDRPLCGSSRVRRRQAPPQRGVISNLRRR